jgi:hypothetical protein
MAAVHIQKIRRRQTFAESLVASAWFMSSMSLDVVERKVEKRTANGNPPGDPQVPWFRPALRLAAVGPEF